MITFHIFLYQLFSNFAKKHKLYAFDAVVTPAQEGSLRIFMSKKKRKQTKRYKKLLKNEIDKKLNTLETSLKFKRKVMDQVSSLKSLIIDLKKERKKIAGYGASAKGLIILKCSNIGKKLEYFVDDSPAKQGFYSPVDHTPVISRRDAEKNFLTIL